MMNGDTQNLQVETHLLDSNRNTVRSFTGELSLPIWEFLKLADVNLDAPGGAQYWGCAPKLCEGFRYPMNGKPFPQYEAPFNRISGTRDHEYMRSSAVFV